MKSHSLSVFLVVAGLRDHESGWQAGLFEVTERAVAFSFKGVAEDTLTFFLRSGLALPCRGTAAVDYLTLAALSLVVPHGVVVWLAALPNGDGRRPGFALQGFFRHVRCVSVEPRSFPGEKKLARKNAVFFAPVYFYVCGWVYVHFFGG